MSKSNVVSHLKQKKINEVLLTGKRMDGRGLEEFRPLIIKSDLLAKSEGSAEVWLGRNAPPDLGCCSDCHFLAGCRFFDSVGVEPAE